MAVTGMIMLDLFAGLGGASQVMRERGWIVTTVDIDPRFGCDITADVSTWQYRGPRPDLLWLSPPCTEFARESMPWCKTGATPDLRLVLSALRHVETIRPRFWILENVRGAMPYLGQPREIHGPFYLWGYFPSLGKPRLSMRPKESYSSKQAAERAMIPRALSEVVAIAVESQSMLLEVA